MSKKSNNNRVFSLFILVMLTIPIAFAQQFNLSAEVRPRYENKHGFGTLIKSEKKETKYYCFSIHFLAFTKVSSQGDTSSFLPFG